VSAEAAVLLLSLVEASDQYSDRKKERTYGGYND
jgi:hypothetical protein